MLNIEKLKKILHALDGTRDDEIGCQDCYEQLDKFVEMLLDGKPAEEAMPLVQHHLKMCGCCQEEYEALLEVIKAAQA